MVPITEAVIKSAIQSKTKKKLPGFDEITSRILKTLAVTH